MIYLIARKILRIASRGISKILCVCLFKANGVIFSTIKTTGIPYVNVYKRGKVTIGDYFSMHNTIDGNPIGVNGKCIFVVHPMCKIVIGNNVGISQSSLIAMSDIVIGDNVKIGGGTCIFTSDFHSLDPSIRRGDNDILNCKCAPVKIGDNVFIGARVIILKGVHIGNNSIIGAGSVVTRDIPENQIWGGNPAKFIRYI